MQKFLRNYLLITLVCVIACLIGITAIYRHAMDSQIINIAQRDAQTLTRILAATMLDNARTLSKLKTLDLQGFRDTAEFPKFDKLFRRYAADFSMLQGYIYQLNGNIVYSTDVGQPTLETTESPSYLTAQTGLPSSEVAPANRMYTVNGSVVNRNVVITYLPADFSGEGVADVILRVDSDVTDRMASLEKIQNKLVIYSGLILFGLIGVFLAMLRRSGYKIQLQTNELARQQQTLHYYTHQDTLTGLPNRQVFKDRLEHAMLRACQEEKLLAVLAIDLDRFKYVNDKFSYQTGDELLVQVAARLGKCLPNYAMLSRTGGGNFAILLEDIFVVDEADDIAKHILAAMSDSFLIEHQALFVTVSIGIALYPFDDDRVDSLLQKSDTALFQAKEAGRNTYRFYNSRQRDKAVSRFALGNVLRQALDHNEFQLYYQPVVQLSSGNIIGVEALLRWHQPSKGIIPPLEFISVLEESGLIIPVGRWVLETACRQGEIWRQQGFGDLKININISAKQFADKNLVQNVEEALTASKLPSYLLNLEITESLLIENRSRVLKVLDQLNENGVSMSVDDFGTGYSSMAYLKNMPIETIKIDKSFVQGIPYDMDDVAIIHAIDYLSRNLRLDVIAEGVETEAQMAFLKKLNVAAIQGYLISRPLPAADFEELFRRHDPCQFPS